MNLDRIRINEEERRAVERWVVAKWGSESAARVVRWLYLVLSVILGAYVVLSVSYLSLDSFLQRVWYLLFILVLVFLILPAREGDAARRPLYVALDLVLLIASVVVSLYIVVDYDGIIWRMGLPSLMDIAMGTVAILVLLEATRRAVGLAMALIVLVFLAYAYLGGYIPGFFGHLGYSHARVINQLYLFQEGIYGVPLGVASTYVFLFVLFGAFLEKTGAGAFFINLAYALTGRASGGPAKAAVVSSALMGSISGSAIANVVTTGTFTIPMMKRVGYEPHEAGGVEAAASTGGQILPPVMGAGAFLMAEFTGIPYVEIVRVSIIPAVMYFVVVFLFVDIIARRKGIRGLPPQEIPRLRATLAEGFHYLIPMTALVYLLFRNYTALQAGVYALALLVLVAMLRTASRLSLREVVDAFQSASRSALMVSVATAAAGVIVGVVSLTGVGLKFSGLMLSLAGDQLLPALFMIAIASLVLGMGLPVTASYVVLIVLAGPALQQMGLALLTAHMIVFWLSQDSNVTPPVALAAFAAAGIAGASPMRTAMAGWKYAKGLYLIPLLMAYTPLLLNGSPLEVARAVASGMLGLVAFAVFLEGYLLRPVTVAERALLALATVGLLTPQGWLDLAGVAVVVGFLVSHFWLRRPPGMEGAASAAGD